MNQRFPKAEHLCSRKLMERLLQNEKSVERIETLRTEAGGLQPWIFIVKKRQIKPTE